MPRVVQADAVAPGTDRLDEVVVLAEAELRLRELALHRAKPLEQGFAVGNHDSGFAAQLLCMPGRQMELAAADIDPHVVVGVHQVGIAREPQPGDIEQRRKPLVRNVDVDMFEMDRVAEVLRRAVIAGLHGHLRVRPDYSTATAGRQ
jgi:hypothetical protein